MILTSTAMEIIRQRIARISHMYDTVGPNHGDIKVLINEEVPKLLDAVEELQQVLGAVEEAKGE